MKTILDFLYAEYLWLKTFFSDSDGKGSFRRLGSSVLILLFCRSYYVASFFTKSIPDIPEMWAFVLMAILGFSIADWYAKSKNENK